MRVVLMRVILIGVLLMNGILTSIIIIISNSMRLCHPPDGSTSLKYKMLCFKPPLFILPNKECTSFSLGYVLPSSALFMVASFPLEFWWTSFRQVSIILCIVISSVAFLICISIKSHSAECHGSIPGSWVEYLSSVLFVFCRVGWRCQNMVGQNIMKPFFCKKKILSWRLFITRFVA